VSTKNVDDVISGPDLSPKKDPVMEYYERIDKKQRAIWDIRNRARELGAPPQLMTLLDEWWHRESNTGD
jgi:hypothetical protein